MVDFPARSVLPTGSVRFQAGHVVATQGAIRAIERVAAAPCTYLMGNLSDEDKLTNEAALEQGDRLLSQYELADGTRIWIITEADRSVTTLLLPDEY